MDESQIIAQVLGEGSLTTGGFLLMVVWLVTRRARSELDQVRSMARDAIDAYQARTEVLKNSTQTISIEGPVHLVERSTNGLRSGEHVHL